MSLVSEMDDGRARPGYIMSALLAYNFHGNNFPRLDSDMVLPYPAELVQLVAQAGDLYLCEVHKVRL